MNQKSPSSRALWEDLNSENATEVERRIFRLLRIDETQSMDDPPTDLGNGTFALESSTGVISRRNLTVRGTLFLKFGAPPVTATANLLVVSETLLFEPGGKIVIDQDLLIRARVCDGTTARFHSSAALEGEAAPAFGGAADAGPDGARSGAAGPNGSDASDPFTPSQAGSAGGAGEPGDPGGAGRSGASGGPGSSGASIELLVDRFGLNTVVEMVSDGGGGGRGGDGQPGGTGGSGRDGGPGGMGGDASVLHPAARGGNGGVGGDAGFGGSGGRGGNGGDGGNGGTLKVGYRERTGFPFGARLDSKGGRSGAFGFGGRGGDAGRPGNGGPGGVGGYSSITHDRGPRGQAGLSGSAAGSGLTGAPGVSGKRGEDGFTEPPRYRPDTVELLAFYAQAISPTSLFSEARDQ